MGKHVFVRNLSLQDGLVPVERTGKSFFNCETIVRKK